MRNFRCFLPIVVGICTFSLLASNNAYAQLVMSIPSVTTVQQQSTASCTQARSGLTVITDAFDGNGNHVCNNGQTSSNSIRFSFIAVTNITGGPLVSNFQCNIDGQGFTTCSSGQTYTGLSVTPHQFVVRSVFQNGNVDPSPPTFTWTVTGTSSTTIPSADTTAANQAATNSAINNANNQAIARSAGATQQAINNAASELQQSGASAVAATLNPPFKQCIGTPANPDLAIYKIQGHGNLQKLFGSSGKGRVPVSLLIYSLPNDPTSLKNVILNVQAGNPFLRGVLVVNPGNINRQQAINFFIDKIETQCKSTTLIDPQLILGVKTSNAISGDQTSSPAVLVSNQADPPFQVCRQSTSSVSAPQQPNSAQGTVTTTTFQNTPSGAATFVTAQNEKTPITTPGQAAGTETGAASDVARYTIRGILDLGQLPDLNRNQHTIFTIVNDLAPFNPSEAKPNKVFSPNNNEFAASVQVNPGIANEWETSFLTLQELSTVCKTLPFVVSPNAIGGNPDDYLPDPITGKAKS